jgi:thiamine pyrophosphate-dependent acetolactate synthase large subunit-like protein
MATSGAQPRFCETARISGEEIVKVAGSPTRSKSAFLAMCQDPPTAFVAATYGRLTGRPAVCISALGPGMLNFCFIPKASQAVCRGD